MTLKEELSLDRKEALAELKQQNDFADNEMRKIIENYINPTIKLMHKKYRTERKLTVTAKNHGSIYFYPQLDIKDYRRPEIYNGELSWEKFVAAAIRVASEFGFKVPKSEEGNFEEFEFTMVLDD